MPSNQTRLAPAKYIRLPLFEKLTGQDVKVIEEKIESGEWHESDHFRRAPDGHTLAITEGGIDVAKYVQLPVFEMVTGYSVKAVRRKIEDKFWRLGHEYTRADDGHILIIMEGYYRWVERSRKASKG